MKQTTLSAGSFDRYSKTTRRAAFLSEMDRVVPWSALCALIEPVYPKAGNGRPPVGLERMLRIYFLQTWFNLSDPAVEEALYDSLSMREFVGIDLGREGAPDETTGCKFRHLLEQHGMGQRLFEEVGRHLQTRGMKVSTGTIVDATIINAPSSTKNQDKARDFTNRKGFRNRGLTERECKKNSRKSSVRAKIEHAFLIIKRLFGFAKVSYRGMVKNGNRLFVVAALANLFMARHHLLRLPQGRSV
jgi:transposase, IS5 family